MTKLLGDKVGLELRNPTESSLFRHYAWVFWILGEEAWESLAERVWLTIRDRLGQEVILYDKTIRRIYWARD